jgi:hypothetical protein
LKIESVVCNLKNFMRNSNLVPLEVMILKEWNRITEPLNYKLLGAETKELVKVIAKEKEDANFIQLSEKEKRLLNLLNEAVREVKLPYAKKLFFEHKELYDLSYAQRLLTSDARFMCYARSRGI